MKTKVIFSIFCLLSVYCLLSAAYCFSAVPSLINYQGVLKDSSGVPIHGDVIMVFSIWDDSIAGNKIWEELQSIVHVNHGLFNVLLGSSTSIPNTIFDNANRYLEVQVNTSILQPRKRIVSVGYANKAIKADSSTTASYATDADKVDGKHADEIGINPSKVYDSGWFAVNSATQQAYTKTHSLGTTKVVAQAWLSDHSDGSGICVQIQYGHTLNTGGDWGHADSHLKGLTTTEITLYVQNYLHDPDLHVTSGYARIIMLALE